MLKLGLTFSLESQKGRNCSWPVIMASIIQLPQEIKWQFDIRRKQAVADYLTFLHRGNLLLRMKLYRTGLGFLLGKYNRKKDAFVFLTDSSVLNVLGVCRLLPKNRLKQRGS